jgi:putative tricarboxylic transport membrane protein
MPAPRLRRRLNPWEIGAALAVLALGAFMVWAGVGYSIGSFRHMGPGFFPVAVGSALMAFSAAIVLEVHRSATPRPDLPLRPLAAITVGLVAFATLVDPLGLVPATLALVVISAFADSAMTPVRAGFAGLAIAGFGWVVFVLGFRLPLHAFWW